MLEVAVDGRVIGTTQEHPFFARGSGWTAAGDLRPGDQGRLMAPGWAAAERVAVTDRVAAVYNLEVEGDHTYFVGCHEWGFAVWAHNAYGDFEAIVTNPNLKKSLTTVDSRLNYYMVAKQGKAALEQQLRADGLHPATVKKARAIAEADGLFAPLTGPNRVLTQSDSVHPRLVPRKYGPEAGETAPANWGDFIEAQTGVAAPLEWRALTGITGL